MQNDQKNFCCVISEEKKSTIKKNQTFNIIYSIIYPHQYKIASWKQYLVCTFFYFFKFHHELSLVINIVLQKVLHVITCIHIPIAVTDCAFENCCVLDN